MKKNRNHIKYRHFIMAAFVFSICYVIAGCSFQQSRLQEYSVQYLDYFDTITSFTIYAEDQSQAQEAIALFKEEMENYHQLCDIYNNYQVNNLKTINDNAGIVAVAVDQELVELLKFSREVYELTDGNVNVAMGSVLSIWHDYRSWGNREPERAQLPDMSQLARAAEHTDISQMVIDEAAGTVYLPDGKMKLDVGAVAKGFVSHRICQKLQDRGVDSALISIGGNVQTIGLRGDGQKWRVGIQDPQGTSGNGYLHAVELQDQALVTSGSYQRYYQVDGQRYHHIIHPDTLMPWNAYQSVTILCADGRMADALSTAVFNMELEDGQELIESLDGTEALWVLEDGQEVRSSGFGQNVIR